jgi:M6 family metalloprotease-like protein
MSTPFKNREFTFTQPDGTSFKVIGTGNRHQAFFRTPDGYAVVRDQSSGFYHFAEVEPDGEAISPVPVRPGAADPARLGIARAVRPRASVLRNSAFTAGVPRTPSRWEIRRNEQRIALATMSRRAAAPPQRQTVGTFVGLCLLIDFPDVPGAIERQEVEDFCNKQSYSGYGNVGSVRDYFYDVSDGKLTYTNIVAPYYTAKHERAYYTNPKISYTQRARELIRDALRHHVQQGALPFSQLTADRKDYVYALNVYYAGRRVNNWSEGLWPHAHHLETPIKLANGHNAYDYQITDMGEELTLGTFCHENGHMVCDFPDLYDYDDDSNGVGVFCLMCGGANVNEKNPTQVGAYLKYAAGWASNVYPSTPNSTVTLRAGKNDFAIHRKSRTEYFIIENRAKKGRDVDLVDAGLAVWRVDELGDNSKQQMTLSDHYECSLVQADGQNDLERDVNEGDEQDLFKPGASFSGLTRPNSNWWDGSGSGLAISEISRAGASLSFSVGAASPAKKKAAKKVAKKKKGAKKKSKAKARKRG